MTRREDAGGKVRDETESRASSAARSAEYFDTGHLKPDLRQRSVRGGMVALASQGARYALMLLSTAVLARLLTPSDYGLVAMASAFTAFLLVFREMGLSTATVQRTEVNHGQISTLFWINLGFGALMALLLIALARPIAWFYGDARIAGVVLVLSLGMPLGALGVQHRALLLRQMRFGTLGTIEIGSVLTGVVAGILMAWRGAGYWALVAVPLATELASVAGIWMACRWRPGPPRPGSGVRGMLGFGGNLTGYHVMNYLARHLDNVLIGKFVGPGDLGLYSRAYALLMLPLRQLNAPLGSVAVPTLSRLADSPERYRRAYCTIARKIQMVSVPAIAFLIVCADWLVLLVLGPGWLEAAAIYALLGLAGIVQPLTQTCGWLFVSQGRGRDMLRWGVIGGSLSILSFLVGLPWGTLGVAAAYGISGPLLRAPLLLWLVSRRGPVSQGDLYRTLKLPFVAACLVAVSVGSLRRLVPLDSPLVGLAASGLLALAAALAVYGAHPEGRRNLAELKSWLLDSRRSSPGTPPAGSGLGLVADEAKRK